MNKIILLLILLVNSAYAQKNVITGNVISADTFNSSTLSVGTVQQSILTVVKFQELNGDCWRLMNGSSVIGTDLAALIAPLTNLPDMTTEGMFVRQATSLRTLGSSELDSFKSHTHGSNDAANKTGNPDGQTDSGYTYWRNGTISSQTSATGGSETRPKNIALNFLIKVNKVCNFTSN